MTLPDLIEIVPLAGPVQAEITVPGSKSVTNRALVLAALRKGTTRLRGALWSEDTQVMVEALITLGFSVVVSPDEYEACNRTIVVEGCNGKIPRTGSELEPIDLFVGNAGTAARFLTALVCLGHGTFRIHGVPRMHERPQGALFEALRELGYRIESNGERLPATVFSSGPNGGSCRVSIDQSSQFASALVLCAPIGGWNVSVVGENAEQAPYLKMTKQLIEQFSISNEEFFVEPDASSGSYFWAVNSLFKTSDLDGVAVSHWPKSGWQIDSEFPKFLPLPSVISREEDLGDSIMTSIMLASFAKQETLFNDLGRLRLQECERVEALRTELTRCGGKVLEKGETLLVQPSQLHGAEVETYNDHRMAMCFAILGLKVPGIRIKNPACVKKTFPNFFQKLASALPLGLGAVILDASNRERIEEQQLFAD